jgi:plasmid segregation protein ParM
LCAYTAIAQFLDPDTTDNIVYMVLACPLSVLKSDTGKEEYRKFIKGDGPISITVNDKVYTFEIADVTIKAEGSGVLYLNPELFEKKTVALVDFGGLNMNFCLYENGVAVPSSRFTEEHGSNALVNLVIDQLTIYKKGNTVSFEVAEKALDEGHLNKFGQIDKDSAEYVEKAKQLFFNEALKLITQRRYNLEESAVVFVGGTADKLQDIIRKDLPHAYIPSNSQWSTAEGLYKVACAKYTRK